LTHKRDKGKYPFQADLDNGAWKNYSVRENVCRIPSCLVRISDYVLPELTTEILWCACRSGQGSAILYLGLCFQINGQKIGEKDNAGQHTLRSKTQVTGAGGRE
jgi:hypothetical protein